jgi:hypothetical protein
MTAFAELSSPYAEAATPTQVKIAMSAIVTALKVLVRKFSNIFVPP